MPFTVNGVGTSTCGARGFVKWPGLGQADRDACECFVVLYLPVLPFKPIHAFDWNGNAYRAIPIRWSMGIFARVFARAWLGWLPAIAAALLATFAVVEFNERHGPKPMFEYERAAAALAAAVVAATTFLVLGKMDRRDVAIRRALGRHEFGSSDPADWIGDLAKAIKPGHEREVGLSYADSARKALTERQFSRAMWDARLCCLLEGRSDGERVTDEILDHPEFQDALFKVGKNGAGWQEAMAPA